MAANTSNITNVSNFSNALSRNGRGDGRRATGFTLIELLIAVGLMAVLAVLCWRGLDTVIRARDGITAASDETRALTVAFTQMEEDLRRSWAARNYRLPSPVVDFSAASANDPVTIELLCETGAEDENDRIQKVVYRLRGGLLERGFSSWRRPRSGDNSALSTAGRSEFDSQPKVTWQPLLSNVSGIAVRAWMEPAATGQGAATWYDARALLPPPGAVNPPTRIISGLEFALARSQRGRIVRVFSIRD